MQKLSFVCPTAQIKQAEAQGVCLGPGHIKISIAARDRTKIAQFLLFSSNHFSGKCKAPAWPREAGELCSEQLPDWGNAKDVKCKEN